MRTVLLVFLVVTLMVSEALGLKKSCWDGKSHKVSDQDWNQRCGYKLQRNSRGGWKCYRVCEGIGGRGKRSIEEERKLADPMAMEETP